MWHRDQRLAMGADEFPATLIGQARLLHVDDLDEDASVAAAQVAVGAGTLVTSDIDRVSEQTPTLIALSTVPIFSAHVPYCPDWRARSRARAQAPLAIPAGCASRLARTGRCCWRAIVCITRRRSSSTPSTTGAGDTFRAAFIYALLQSHAPPEILRFACATQRSAARAKGQ